MSSATSGNTVRTYGMDAGRARRGYRNAPTALGIHAARIAGLFFVQCLWVTGEGARGRGGGAGKDERRGDKCEQGGQAHFRHGEFTRQAPPPSAFCTPSWFSKRSSSCLAILRPPMRARVGGIWQTKEAAASSSTNGGE
jgi:hypothetical protein